MSKLGKKPIVLPKESTVKVEGDTLLVSGPKGTHKVLFNSKMFSSKINEKNEFHISPISKDKKTSLMWGTYRSLVNNAVVLIKITLETFAFSQAFIIIGAAPNPIEAKLIKARQSFKA